MSKPSGASARQPAAAAAGLEAAAEQIQARPYAQAQARLRWQCRRGMLELDLLLNQFLDDAYAALDHERQADFVRLLGYSDQILYDWLIGQAVPADPALGALVALIQQAMHEQDSPSSITAPHSPKPAGGSGTGRPMK